MSSVFESTEKHTAQEALLIEREAHAGTRARLKLLERSLLNFVPRNLISFIGKDNLTDVEPGDQAEKNMSVVFSDIRDFTSLSESMTSQQTFNMINSYLSVMNPVVTAHHGMIDKYMGDAIMALFPTTADDALSAAIAMLARLDEYNAGRERAAYVPIRIGIGINTGLLILGVVGGKNRMECTVLGHTVNMASRLQTLTKTYGISLLITEHTLYSLSEPEKFLVRHLGRVRIARNSTSESIYEVFNHDAPHVRQEKRRTIKKFEEALACYHSRDVARARPLLEDILQDNPDDIPAKIFLQHCNNYVTSGIYMNAEELTGETVLNDQIPLNPEFPDTQHQNLLALIDDLHQSVIKRTDQTIIYAQIEKLKYQLKIFFDVQEQQMLESDYPFAADHIAQHHSYKQFLEKLGSEIEVDRENTWYAGFRIKLFLGDWLINHAYRDDQHFKKFLSEI
jgi:hemerythrin